MVDPAFALVLAGGLTPFFLAGGKKCHHDWDGNFFFFFFWGVGSAGGKSVSQRCLPAIGRLVFFFGVDSAFAFARYWPAFFFLGVVDSAFALVLVGGLTPFFFRGRGEKCYHPAFDWVLEGSTKEWPKRQSAILLIRCCWPLRLRSGSGIIPFSTGFCPAVVREHYRLFFGVIWLLDVSAREHQGLSLIFFLCLGGGGSGRRGSQ